MPLHYPSVGAFAVGTNADVGIEPEANQEVAEKHCMILRITTASCEEALHRVPNFDLILAWCLQPLERDERYKPCSMQW